MKLGYVVATPEVSAPRMPAVRGGFGEALAELAGLGYDGVELAVRDPKTLDRRALERALRESGLAVPLVGTAPINHQEGWTLCHPDAGVRAAAMARFREVMQFAAALDCPVNVGGFRGSLLAGERREESEGWMRDALRAGADCAASLGIRVLFEPHHRFSTNFGNTVAEGTALLDEMNHPALGLMIDTFHMNIEDASLPAAVLAAGGRIDYVHAADSNRLHPGGGHVPFGEVLRALRTVGYDGWITAQIDQKPSFPEAARRTRDHLRSLM